MLQKDMEAVIVRLQPELKRELEAVAREEKRSVSGEVRVAIENHLEANRALVHDGLIAEIEGERT